MSEQPGLWGDDGLPPYQRHSETSLSAAVAIEPKAGTLRAMVLTWLRDRGDNGGTDEEMQTGIPMDGNTQRPRRRELQKTGMIRNSGKTRKTMSGKPSVVWVAT